MADNHVLTLTGAQLDAALIGAQQAIRYGAQSLTAVQQAQARANIGAATVAEVIAALPTYNGEVEDT